MKSRPLDVWVFSTILYNYLLCDSLLACFNPLRLSIKNFCELKKKSCAINEKPPEIFLNKISLTYSKVCPDRDKKETNKKTILLLDIQEKPVHTTDVNVKRVCKMNAYCGIHFLKFTLEKQCRWIL